ncbi:ATP-dependent RecD-like DNA helicase [bacterium]|nr:ATP-dependent RecD-like DNA helicase [bacterium]
MTETNLEVLKGIVRTITFRNEDNGYTIAKIEPEGKRGIVAVTGYVKLLCVGESVVFRGYWVNDPKYGKQFKFESYESVVPSTLDGIERFLSSKFIKGIGPVFAQKIVRKFGKDTIKILDESPERLSEVPGLNRTKVKAVIEGWKTHRHIRDIMIFLQSHDISPAYASKIYEQYGTETVDKMRSNPYRLIRDIRGIGFIKADQIAKKLGIGQQSPDRVRAGIMYGLDDLIDKGHIYVPRQMLIEQAAAMLELDAAEVIGELDFLKKNGSITGNEERIYRADLYKTECLLAQRLRLLASTSLPKTHPERSDIESEIGSIEQSRGIAFASQQREAILTAARSDCMVLTGGPGTGKTTTVLGMIDMFRRLRRTVVLCAPTGRAAKRLSEATGMEAKTIHRLLEYDPYRGKFSKNEGNTIAAHVVIMDEASMVDTVLMADFLGAVSPYSTLVIVGDVDQLPSIGPGNVLRDIIGSGTVSTIRLTEIFRQAASSRIVQSAHRINTGKLPFTDNEFSGNFFFIRKSDPAEVTSTIVDMISRRLPSRYGFNPVADIQVLSPMHKSETGVANLNALLQERLNPGRQGVTEFKKGGWVFRRGDKVMQVRNNYDKMVFNGDIGRIERIDSAGVRVRFDEPVEYTGSEIDDLVPAYAISVHKSQGSEFRCIVMPVTTQHFIMLRRNLLYTAVTRARELVVLVGDVKALAIAVNNDQVSERYTSLAERLREL